MASRKRTIITRCNAAADWTAIVTNAVNIALATQKFSPNGAIRFDKDASAPVAGGIAAVTDKNLTSPILYRDDDLLGATFYLPSIANVTKVMIYLGSSDTAYLRWDFLVAGLQAGWNSKTTLLGNVVDVAGTGWDMNSVKYVAFSVATNPAATALAGIILDQIYVDQAEPETAVS